MMNQTFADGEPICRELSTRVRLYAGGGGAAVAALESPLSVAAHAKRARERRAREGR
jgi:hypothetical protein